MYICIYIYIGLPSPPSPPVPSASPSRSAASSSALQRPPRADPHRPHAPRDAARRCDRTWPTVPGIYLDRNQLGISSPNVCMCIYVHIFRRLALGIVSLLVELIGTPISETPIPYGKLMGMGVPSLGVPINSMDVYKQVFVWVCTYIYYVCVVHLVSFIHLFILIYLFIDSCIHLFIHSFMYVCIDLQVLGI